MKIGVYPGSFDPITNGHLDIISRSLKLFDKVIILVAINSNKKSIFTVEERLKMIKDATKGSNVEVDFTSGLTVNYAKKVGAKHLIRGLRAVSDFEYEFKIAAGNEFVDDGIDMIFFMSHKDNTFISSSTINELYKNGVDITPLVPKSVIEAYKNREKIN